jgi:hypothetical protein
MNIFGLWRIVVYFSRRKNGQEDQFAGIFFIGNRLSCEHKKTVALERATVFFLAIR